MRCPMCHEELLPDAYVCRFCGASIAAEAATGVTQRLDPADVAPCPFCRIPMRAGFLHSPLRAGDVWWVAGAGEPEPWNGRLFGEQRLAFPVSVYRCGQCGYLAAFARAGTGSPPA